MIEWMV